MIYVGLAVLIFSIYRLLIANDPLTLGSGILRVSLAMIGIAALRFDQLVVLYAVVIIYSLLAILLFALSRNEVQLK